VKVKEGKEWKEPSTRAKGRIAKKIANLWESKGELLAKIAKRKQLTSSSLPYVERFNSIDSMVQSVNRLPAATGLSTISIDNFSVFPMLKAPVSKYLRTSKTDWNERVQTIKDPQSNDALKALNQGVSKKTKGNDNSGRNQNASRGNDPNKGEPNSPTNPGNSKQKFLEELKSVPRGVCANYYNGRVCKRANCRFQHQGDRAAKNAAQNVPNGAQEKSMERPKDNRREDLDQDNLVRIIRRVMDEQLSKMVPQQQPHYGGYPPPFYRY
jgi:hypothetical protein